MKKNIICFILICFTVVVMCGCNKKTNPVGPAIKSLPNSMSSYNPSDEVYIPDENFKQALLDNSEINTNNDDKITYEEAEKAEGVLYIKRKKIRSLIGIKAFKNIKQINCSYNYLTSLDISGCNALEWLNCGNNNISTLDVSDCSELKYLSCKNNGLINLDVSDCRLLKYLRCDSNKIISLNVSGCSELEYLYCNNNRIISFNISGCSALKYLYCNNNRIISLNVSGCGELNTLLSKDNGLTTLDVSGCTKLKYFNIQDQASRELKIKVWRDFNINDPSENFYRYESNHPNVKWEKSEGNENEVYILDENFKQALLDNININTNGDDKITYEEAKKVTEINIKRRVDIKDLTGIRAFSNIKQLNCKSCKNITSLDLSGFESLRILECSYNQINELNVSGCTSLKYLACTYNKITDLNLSNCPELRTIVCYSNSLVELDLYNCSSLRTLRCQRNSLAKLDLSNCRNLSQLYCYENKINELDISCCSKLNSLVMQDQDSDELAMMVWENFDINNPGSNFYKYDNNHPNVKWVEK